MPQALLAKSEGFEFYTYTPSRTRAEVLAKALDGFVIDDLSKLSEMDIILLSCKPQQFQDLSQDIKQYIGENSLVISMLAGINHETLKSELSHHNVIRIMPNITAKVGKGSIIVYPAPNTEQSKQMQFLRDLSKFYPVVNEKAFDELMLVTGSGPAYIYMFINAVEKYLKNQGHDAKLYKQAIIDTFSGALELMQLEKEMSSTEFIERVASKGGVTQEALNVFTDSNFDDIVNHALKAGVKHSKALQDAVRK